MNVTENELHLLRCIYNDDFQDGMQDTPFHAVWTFSVSRSFGGKKAFSGTCGSCVAKGLVESHDGDGDLTDAVISLTPAGLEALKATFKPAPEMATINAITAAEAQATDRIIALEAHVAELLRQIEALGNMHAANRARIATLENICAKRGARMDAMSRRATYNEDTVKAIQDLIQYRATQAPAQA